MSSELSSTPTSTKPKPSTLHGIPLFFSEVQKQEIDRSLMRLADRIAAPLVMVADVSGRLIIYRGRLSSSQSTALAALSAASFAAGVEIGNFLGLRNKNAFRHQLHEGAAANLYTLAVDTELLLIVAYTNQTTLGLVRVYAQQTQLELMELIKVAMVSRQEEDVRRDGLRPEDKFGEKMNQQLDDLFSL